MDKDAEKKEFKRNNKNTAQNLAYAESRVGKVDLRTLRVVKSGGRKKRVKSPETIEKEKKRRCELKKIKKENVKAQVNLVKKFVNFRNKFEQSMSIVMLIVALYLPLASQIPFFSVSKAVFDSFGADLIELHLKEVIELEKRRRHIVMVKDALMFEKYFSHRNERWTTLRTRRGGKYYADKYSVSKLLKFFGIDANTPYVLSSRIGDSWHKLTEEFVGRVGEFPLDFNSIEDGHLVRRKRYWGIVGPYLPVTKEFVIKYTDLQCIRWKATKELIYDFLYEDDRWRLG